MSYNLELERSTALLYVYLLMYMYRDTLVCTTRFRKFKNVLKLTLTDSAVVPSLLHLYHSFIHSFIHPLHPFVKATLHLNIDIT